MTLPHDYTERVYAGVLGKLIGVYLGRPFEGWKHERIMDELGEIWYYVHEQLGKRLIVTDDDITGTFAFLRALPDHGNDPAITPAQIGETWLNTLIEERTILWWGGLGNSTEHTAYLRLKDGIEAPRSGSIELNSKVVAEQIGAQIFIDGWAMVAPGDPALAADLAQRAASVSHDGEAVYAAQVLAAMEAQAFVESDIDALLDTGVSFIPEDSIIYQLIADLRAWREEEPDWRKAFQHLRANYGYEIYGGNCHVVPNHGLIVLSLLYGDDDFQKTLMIVNTCGWDTDCNSGNVGCLMGIKNGLAGIDDGPDWRGPVADRLYLPTANGDRAITDAVRETIRVVNVGRALADKEPIVPKAGAHFHFDLPGAVQGFQPEESTETEGTLCLENVRGHSAEGERSLALHFAHLARGRAARASTPTFVPEGARDMPGYALLASPTLYPGQRVRARLVADEGNRTPVTVRLYTRTYGEEDALHRTLGPERTLAAGDAYVFEWQIDETNGHPIAEIGVEIRSDRRADGTLYLDYLTWDGAPDVTLTQPDHSGTMWRRAWVDGVDHYDRWYPEPYRLIQDRGTGLLIQGTREWTDYAVAIDVTPHMVRSAGLAARVQGMRRYYALLLCDDDLLRLVKARDGQGVLAETEFPWTFDQTYRFELRVHGRHIEAIVDGERVFAVTDPDRPLEGGAIALVCEEGRTATQSVRVRPLDR